MDNKNDTINEHIHLWCKRLTEETFDETDENSNDKNVSEMDLEAFLRGKWNKRRDFLFSSIGFGIGLANIWRFPFKVLKFGGGTFVFLYIFFSSTLGLSMVLLEMGLGQFTSMCNTQAYKCVPILFGVAWSQVTTNIINLIYYAVVISWVYIYLFGCFKPTLPWSSCNNTFNTPKCISNYESSLNKNETFKSSTHEFFHRHVLGIEKPNGELFTMDEKPGTIEFHRSLSLFIVWLLAFLSVTYGIKSSSKVIYITALCPYLPLILLFTLGCTLPGGGAGLLFYIKPNMTAFTQLITYVEAFEHTMYSMGIGLGAYTSLSSHNNFHDNFIRDGVCVVIVDCITSIFSGLAGFTFIGYLAYKNNKTIKNVFPSNSYGLYFVTYSEALRTISQSNFFTMVFMIMTILIGMDSHFIMLESVITSLVDTFVKPLHITFFRIVLAVTICTVSYLCGLLLITSGGLFYFAILEGVVSFYIIPIIGFFQCMTLGIIYGHDRFRKDIKMMLGYKLPKYLFIIMSFLCPFAFSMIIVNQIVIGRKITVHENPINQLGYIIFYVLLLFLIAPIFIGGIYVIIQRYLHHDEGTFEEYMQSLITPPIWYGPRYKVNWLLDKEYRQKFIKYRNYPEFLRHVSPLENIRIIHRAIKVGQSSHDVSILKESKTTTNPKRKITIHKK